MKITEILECIRSAPGSKAKMAIMQSHSGNALLKRVLVHGTDISMPFNIVKVPKTIVRNVDPFASDLQVWQQFFNAVRMCADRTVTGNAAVAVLQVTFSSSPADDETWMRKILKKRLAIGVSTKTINKVFPGLIQTFDVSLANKFDWERTQGRNEVGIEPKLDGIRCFSIVENGDVKMFARSGKLITNFQDTLAPELVKLGDGCYDGELMGKDFVSLMRQAYRKDGLDTSATYLALFDYLPLEEWKSKKTVMTCAERHEILLDHLAFKGANLDLLHPVERWTVENCYGSIKECHDEFVKEGFEGAMVKFLDAPYRFGRGWEIMKFKAFHDVDLPIEGYEEGTGRHTGKLGAIVVDHKGVRVKVGSGFSDDLREQIWANPDFFMGRIVEIRYQEITPDGSLRFPTFVCFRNDK